MLKKILNAETKSIAFASFILGIATLTSAVLGLFRDRLLAGRFGIGDDLDVYYAAFRIPDFVAMVFIMGAISAAVIPVFSEYFVKSKEQAWKFASNLINLFLLTLTVICIFLVIFTPQLVFLIAPGFKGEKRELLISVTRIMFLSPILLGTSNVISGILQIFQRFIATALAPIFYNFGIIFGILYFAPKFGIKGLAFGVVLGGFMHLLIQLPAFIVSGFKLKPLFNISDAGFLKVIKLMVPRSLGLAASQINLTVITAIASTLSSGSIAIFNLANNLASLLVGLTVIPFSTAAFPKLSMAYANKENDRFIKIFSSVVRQIFFLVIPLSLLFYILRAQIVRITLGTGRFGWSDTRLTAACLGIFSLAIFAQGLSLLLSKTFYSVYDTKTPALLSFITVGITIFLGFFLIWILKFQNVFSDLIRDVLRLKDVNDITVVGLPLAFSISAVCQAALLLFFLKRKVTILGFSEIRQSLNKVLLSSLFLVFFAYLIRTIVANFVNMRTFAGVFIQTISTGIIGLLAYVVSALFLKSAEIKSIEKLLLNNFLPRKKKNNPD